MVAPSQPQINAMPCPTSRAYPVGLIPNRSPHTPTTIRNSAPLSRGSATNRPFCEGVSPKSFAISTPSAPINSHTMKLTSKCNHAPSNEGQCPARTA